VCLCVCTGDMKELVILLLFVSIWVIVGGFVCCQRPAVVNIGAIFTFDSVIGKAAKPAMEAAVSDVNNDSRIRTKLNLLMDDVNSSVFLGTIDGNFQILCLSFSLFTFFLNFAVLSLIDIFFNIYSHLKS